MVCRSSLAVRAAILAVPHWSIADSALRTTRRMIARPRGARRSTTRRAEQQQSAGMTATGGRRVGSTFATTRTASATRAGAASRRTTQTRSTTSCPTTATFASSGIARTGAPCRGRTTRGRPPAATAGSGTGRYPVALRRKGCRSKSLHPGRFDRVETKILTTALPPMALRVSR
jgi:hypothetical protein